MRRVVSKELTMSLIYLVSALIQYALHTRSLIQPEVGDIILRKLELNSTVEYSFYEHSEGFFFRIAKPGC